MRKRATVVVTALMMLMSTATAAYAAEDAADTEGTIVSGSGVVVAKGKGKAVIAGEGVVRMALNGNVTIWDNAGDARVFIGPHPADEADATADTRLAAGARYHLEDVRGLIVVKGSDFKIRARGKMRFKARGTGAVFLKGRGRWHTGNGTAGTWGATGLRVRYGVTLDERAA